MATVELAPEHLRIVRDVLARHLPGREVYVFGSRAHGRGLKRWSDLDLAIAGDAPLGDAAMAEAGEAFDDSALPMRVDLVLLAQAPAWLRQQIEAHGVAIHPVPVDAG